MKNGLTNCIFSKSRQGLWMWCIRLCLYRFFEAMARLSTKRLFLLSILLPSWDLNSNEEWAWHAPEEAWSVVATPLVPLQSLEEGRGKAIAASCTRGIVGGGLVDLLGLCKWLGGVVENSTGVALSGGGGDIDDEELLEFGRLGRLFISSNSSSDEWLPPSISELWHDVTKKVGVAEVGVAKVGVALESLMLLLSPLLLLLVVVVTSNLFNELLLSRPKRAWLGVLDGRGRWPSSSVRSIVSEKEKGNQTKFHRGRICVGLIRILIFEYHLQYIFKDCVPSRWI